MTGPVGIFNKTVGQEPTGLPDMPVWKHAHPLPDVDILGFMDNTWNADCFQT